MLRDVLIIAPILCMLSLTDCSSGSSATQAILPTVQTTVAGQSAITASPQAAPPNVVLDASSNPLQDLSVYETGYSGAFTITSSNTSVVTVTPGLVLGEFMINELSTGSVTLLVKDANGGSLTVPVSAL
jgi:hypothetical protein